MNNFIFNVQEISGAGNHALISGKHYSGLIRSGEKVCFASRAGGIERLTDDVAYAKHTSADMLVVNMPYSGTAYDAKGKTLMVQYVSSIEAGGRISKTANQGSRAGVKFKGVYTWQLDGCDSVLRENS